MKRSLGVTYLLIASVVADRVRLCVRRALDMRAFGQRQSFLLWLREARLEAREMRGWLRLWQQRTFAVEVLP